MTTKARTNKSARVTARTASTQLIWLPTGGHLGDAIFITALFGEILEKAPDTKILYAVRRNAALISELTRAYPNITVVPLSSSPVALLKTMWVLLRKKSIVIGPPPRDTHPLSVRILCALFVLRGDVVEVFSKDGTFKEMRTVERVYDMHERYIKNLREGVNAVGIHTDFLSAPPQMKFDSSLPANFPFAHKKYIVVHPFPHMAVHKTLPLRRWHGLLRALRARFPEYGIVLTGAEVDRASAEELSTPTIPNFFTAIGLSILEVAGIIENAALYIGVDTGPTHLAGVLHAPSVVIAQQNEPLWLPSYNPNATLLWNKDECVCGIPGKNCVVIEDGKSYRRCVYFVTDDEILSAVETKLS